MRTGTVSLADYYLLSPSEIAELLYKRTDDSSVFELDLNELLDRVEARDKDDRLRGDTAHL